MRFVIDSGLPYLVNNGKAYPVEIKDGVVRVDEDNATLTQAVGSYTQDEIRRKFGRNISSIKPKKTKKDKE